MRVIQRSEGRVATHENDIETTEWSKALLEDPSLRTWQHSWRGLANSHNDQDSFMQNTLSTPETIRDHVILVPVKASSQSYPRIPEVLTIYSLGSSLMGHAMIAHGGLVATLLDEIMGVAININEQSEAEHDPTYKRKSIMTLKLDLLYKKPVPAPGLILARAVLKKAEGRKRYVTATLEDGQGTILTEAEALFLELKRRPRVNKI